MSAPRLALLAVLVGLGAGWGLVQPLAVIAVSDGHKPYGLIFWQLGIAVALLVPAVALRGGGLPLHRRALALYAAVATVGTLVPAGTGYRAAADLPAGILSLLLSLIPLLAFPVALVLGLDRFSALRLFGLVLGFCGVLLLVLPEAALPDRAMLAVLPIALVAPIFYALEGNIMAKWGTGGLGPLQVILGSSLIGLPVAGALALALGQWITPPLAQWGAPETALVALSVVDIGIYAGYVWLVMRAGAVFAAQVSYLVTGFGMVWSMLLLDESFSLWVWAAMGVMFLGLALVQPRPAALPAPLPAAPPAPPLAPRSPSGEGGA